MAKNCRFRADLRELVVIAFVFLTFLAISVTLIPRLPAPLSAVAYILVLFAVGTFLVSRAKKE